MRALIGRCVSANHAPSGCDRSNVERLMVGLLQGHITRRSSSPTLAMLQQRASSGHQLQQPHHRRYKISRVSRTAGTG